MNPSEEYQKSILTQGMTFRTLSRPATIGDGIHLLPEDELHRLGQKFSREANHLQIVRFVPSSGAASRMFADLQKVLSGEVWSPAERLFAERARLPFHVWLRVFNLRSTSDLAEAVCGQLKLDQLPKGLIPFHLENDKIVTAFEEQLAEAQAVVGVEEVHVHFTVSPGHELAVRAFVEAALAARPDGDRFSCTYSHQDLASDTICIGPDGSVVVGPDNKPLRRPGGHGALLANLAAIDADVIFVKNIDNVQPKRLQAAAAAWKGAMAGLGLEIQSAIKQVLNPADGDVQPDPSAVAMLRRYFPHLPEHGPDRVAFLNRPLRVCGMVKNEGAPGGGPFWLRDEAGSEALQIVEGAETDPNNAEQQAIAAGATHFNPVDLVCFTRDFRGEKFDLGAFTRPDAVFIAHKTHNGMPIRALEWPGLWNGGMAGWLTVFVEVPSFTFSPVKTVADLLRPEHGEL